VNGFELVANKLANIKLVSTADVFFRLIVNFKADFNAYSL